MQIIREELEEFVGSTLAVVRSTCDAALASVEEKLEGTIKRQTLLINSLERTKSRIGSAKSVLPGVGEGTHIILGGKD